VKNWIIALARSTVHVFRAILFFSPANRTPSKQVSFNAIIIAHCTGENGSAAIQSKIIYIFQSVESAD
jgi:hypothetical protein